MAIAQKEKGQYKDTMFVAVGQSNYVGS